MNAQQHNASITALFANGLRVDTLTSAPADTPAHEAMRSLRGMDCTECPCGCGSAGVCDAQLDRVRQVDAALPF